MTTTTCPQPSSTKRPNLALELRPLAAHFDKLPDDATVSIKVFSAVTGEGISTLWSKAAKGLPGFPKLIRRGPKCTRLLVGEIRAYAAGKGAA